MALRVRRGVTRSKRIGIDMPRRSHRDKNQQPDELDFDRIRAGVRRVETKRGHRFVVQPISEKNAQKEYRCPGCDLIVPPGQAHIVAWEEHSLFGADRGVEDRRHWHSHCWRIY
jgi:hypothetical protein